MISSVFISQQSAIICSPLPLNSSVNESGFGLNQEDSKFMRIRPGVKL